MTKNATAERDIDAILLQARSDAQRNYRENTPDLLQALERVRQEYLENAPAWNFVLGNLIDENKHLRKSNGRLITTILAVVLAFIIVIALVVIWAFRNGGTQYVPYPVDSKTGVTAGRPLKIGGWVPAGEAEQIRVLKALVPELFAADIHHQTNEDRWSAAQIFLAPTATQDILGYRSQRDGAFDPFAIGASGRYSDIVITRIQPHFTPGVPSLYEIDWDEHYTTLQNRDIGTVHRTGEFTVTSSEVAASIDNPQGVKVTKFHPGLAGVNP